MKINFFSSVSHKCYTKVKSGVRNLFSTPLNDLSLENKIPQSNYGKHLIPRYLYHLTNIEHYEDISRQGVIAANKELFMGESIFMVDLENFLKFWDIIVKKYNKPLKEALIDRVQNNSSGIVLLKIDTSKISKKDLRIRSQNIIFDPDLQAALKAKAKKSLFGYSYSQKVKKKFSHFFYGDDALNANLYKQLKQSIEYVYPFDILKDSYTKIGEVKLDSDKSAKMDFLTFMQKLLKNQPEIKAVDRFVDKK